MTQQIINVGNVANDGQGTPLRTAFQYINDNFTELYNGTGSAEISNGTSNINIVSSNGNVTTSVSGTSNVMVVSSTTVAITGNITVTGAPTTGLAAAVIGNVGNVNLHSQSVAVMGGNANGSVQFAFQNYSALANASTDLAIYNNAGTDSTYFIDIGIVGNTYNGSAVGANIFGANDGYMYVAGNSITGPVGTGANVGNLILGATNGQVITWLGNTSTANIITVVGTTGLSVTGVMSASGNVTAGNVLTAGIVKTTAKTYATLPTAANAGAGARSFITDGNTATFGSQVNSGGSNAVPVWSNGTNWYVG